MDVIGTAAAIIQLAGVGLALAKTLYSLYDEGAAGNEQVKELSSYVHITATVLEEIGQVFEEEGKSTKPLISNNAITTATDIVTRCSTTFNTLQEMANNAQKTTMGLLMLPLKTSRLKLLQAKLEQSKLDLQLMMQIILYARLKNDPRASGNESDQRKVVENTIEERNAAHTRCIQAAEAERTTTIASPINAIALQSPRDNNRNSEESAKSQAEAIRSLEGPTGTSGSAVPSKLPVDGRVRSGDERVQHQKPHPSRDHSPDSPGGGQVSYRLALSVVCCPCFSGHLQRHTSQLPLDERTTSPEVPGERITLSQVPEPPPTHATMTPPPSQALAKRSKSQLMPPPPAPRGIKRPATVPGEFYRNENLSDIAMPYSSPSPLPRWRFQSSASEVDRLLREWTTIYDAFSPANEESAGDGGQSSQMG